MNKKDLEEIIILKIHQNKVDYLFGKAYWETDSIRKTTETQRVYLHIHDLKSVEKILQPRNLKQSNIGEIGRKLEINIRTIIKLNLN